MKRARQPCNSYAFARSAARLVEPPPLVGTHRTRIRCAGLHASDRGQSIGCMCGAPPFPIRGQSIGFLRSAPPAPVFFLRGQAPAVKLASVALRAVLPPSPQIFFGGKGGALLTAPSRLSDTSSGTRRRTQASLSSFANGGVTEIACQWLRLRLLVRPGRMSARALEQGELPARASQPVHGAGISLRPEGASAHAPPLASEYRDTTVREGEPLARCERAVRGGVEE